MNDDLLETDPVSGRRDASYLRRELDRQYVNRLQRLEERLEGLEKQAMTQSHMMEIKIDEFIHDMDRRLTHIDVLVNGVQASQDKQEPTIKILEDIVHSGITLRWMIGVCVAVLAAFAAIATALDTLRGWFPK